MKFENETNCDQLFEEFFDGWFKAINGSHERKQNNHGCFHFRVELGSGLEFLLQYF